jgi:hypothetical protein
MISNLNEDIDLEYVEMTDVESDLWEKHFLEKVRYETGNSLKNRQNPISKRRFMAMQKSGKFDNVCSFI